MGNEKKRFGLVEAALWATVGATICGTLALALQYKESAREAKEANETEQTRKEEHQAQIIREQKPDVRLIMPGGHSHGNELANRKFFEVQLAEVAVLQNLGKGPAFEVKASWRSNVGPLGDAVVSPVADILPSETASLKRMPRSDDISKESFFLEGVLHLSYKDSLDNRYQRVFAFELANDPNESPGFRTIITFPESPSPMNHTHLW